MGVTIKEVAEEADVSITTVSAVINNTRYVSPELTDRVQQAIRKLNYYPDQMGRGLRKGQSNTIGLIISDIENPFFPRIARGVEDSARENDYNLILGNTDEDPVEEQHYISLLLSQRVDGLIITPSTKGKENIQPMLEKSIPLVLIDRAIEDQDIPSVTSDNYSGSYRAVEYLIEKGHRKIGFVGGIKGIQSTDKRLEGYKDALEDYNIKLKDELINRGNSKIQDSYKATKKLMAKTEDITAIFAANNLIIIGILQYLKESSLTYPEEISVVCFDDPAWGSAVNPGITSVSQKPYRMGYKAAQQLFYVMGDGKEQIGETGTVVSTELKKRGSVKTIDKDKIIGG